MKNRFENCNSLVDLYCVFATVKEVCDYNALTESEKESVLSVYCSSGIDGAESLERPMSEAGYTEIWNNVFVIVETLNDAAKAAKQEEKSMRNNKFINRVTGFYNATANAVNSAKVHAGQDAKDFRDSCDSSITSIKDALGGVLEYLDILTGATALKNQLMNLIYKNTVGTSTRRGFFDCAAMCRSAVHRYIDTLLALDPDEEDLETVTSLRYMLGEDEDGNPIEGCRSIFAVFANGIVWICKKVARKLRQWFSINEESNIFGCVGAGIASVFGTACGVISGAVRIAVNFVVFVGSYVLSAAINAIAFIVEKISGWVQKAKEKFSKADERADEEYDWVLEEEEMANGAV